MESPHTHLAPELFRVKLLRFIMLEKIKHSFTESIQIQIAATELLPEQIDIAAQAMVTCLLSGKKVITCGHGRAYAIADILRTSLLNRFHLLRPSLPAIQLTLDGTYGSSMIADGSFNDLYTAQFDMIANSGDLLIIFAQLEQAEAIYNLINRAIEKDIQLIVLSNIGNDHISGMLSENDIELIIDSSKESRIMEGHLLISNILCELIEHKIFAF